jgi:hypothetical protein
MFCINKYSVGVQSDIEPSSGLYEYGSETSNLTEIRQLL